MLNVTDLVSFLLLATDSTVLATALARERSALAQIYGGVQHLDVTLGTKEVTLNAVTNDVILAAFNRILLDRASELVLDSLNVDWRADTTGPTRTFVYRGEEQLQTLRLVAPPEADGRLQLIDKRQPDPDIALWHNVYLVLAVIQQIASSDILRARLPFAEIAGELIKLMLEPFSMSVPRSERK